MTNDNKAPERGDTVSTDDIERDPEFGFPSPGAVLKRLRTQQGMSLRDVSHKSGLSTSFLGTVERGESDIALERLAKLARVFGHDVGSFLGFSARQSTPTFMTAEGRVRVERGEGIDYEVIRLPGIGVELVRVTMAPMSRFASQMSHEGVDVTLVVSGTVCATYNGEDYVLDEGECVMWSGGYSHSFRNDTSEPASYIGFVTATVF